jgi:penicillin-binding protein 2
MKNGDSRDAMGKKITVCIYVVVVIFTVFVFRLWDLQVIKGKRYRDIAENNRLRVVGISAPRGIIYDRYMNPLVRNIPSFDISVTGGDLSVDDRTMTALGKLIGLDPGVIKKNIVTGQRTPFQNIKLKMGVTFEEVARVEAGKIDFPGIQIDAVIDREYSHGNFASHLIGYLGRLNREQSVSPEYEGVPSTAFIGQRGVEKIYDSLLRGTAGKRFLEVDATGNVIRTAGVQYPVKGDDITLTIDLTVQSEAEKSLKGMTGAVVVLDAENGEILAMASSPSFDPNVFARGISYSDWKGLVLHPGKPLLNRAIQSQYPPGSTFKIITAFAALEEGLITDETRFNCKGSIKFGRDFRCWKSRGHGLADLYRAIVESCDVFFYEIGKRLSIDTLARYALGFGLGVPVGIELEDERAGIVPSTDWKLKCKKEKWYRGETLNTVIGQGYLTATPIQVARFLAAAINGGKVLRPHILKKEDGADNIIRRMDLKAGNVEFIRRSLVGVVEESDGTGNLARSEIVGIGGKTGTTQVIGKSERTGRIPERFRDHAWFMAYAPVDDPRIVIAVFVEHGGHGSTVAAPIAKRVIEAYFRRHSG